MLLPDKGPVGQEFPDQNQGQKNICDSVYYFTSTKYLLKPQNSSKCV